MKNNKQILVDLVEGLEIDIKLKGNDVCTLLGYQNYVIEKRENNEPVDPRIVLNIFKLLKSNKEKAEKIEIPEGLIENVLNRFPELSVKGRKSIIYEIPDFTGNNKPTINKNIVPYTFTSLLEHVISFTLNNIIPEKENSYKENLCEIYSSINQYVAKYMSKANQSVFNHYKKAILATYIGLQFKMSFTSTKPKNELSYSNKELFNMSNHTLNKYLID